MIDEIETIKLDTKKNTERLDRLSGALEKEKDEAAQHEEKILGQIRKNEKKKELEMKIDANMMLIQKTFEEWLKINGPSKKKRGKKKKKK